MPHSIMILLSALLLASCAATPSPSQHGLDQLNSGNGRGAYNTFVACSRQGDSSCMNNIGFMYENGHMDTGPDVKSAIEWYTLAARYGQPVSQQNLMRLGAPIPPADLRPQTVVQGRSETAELADLLIIQSAITGQ